MKLTLCSIATTAIASLALVGCVDNDYDLSDIDSTAELKIKDLVLPLNLDDITLSDVLEIEEGSRLQVINGEYVLMEDGTFASENISIPTIEIAAPVIAPSEQTIKLEFDQNTPMLNVSLPDVPTLPEMPTEFWYNIEKSDDSHFDYEVGNVSDHITTINNVDVDMSMTIYMSVSGVEDYINGFEFRDIHFQFPKGLTLDYDTEKYSYNFETGEFQFNDGYVARATEISGVKGLSYQLMIKVNSIDFVKANAKYNAADHSMMFSDDVSILSGKAHLTLDDFKTGHDFLDMPTEAQFEIGFGFSDLKVNRFSGGVQYAIDGINIEPITLNGIPDFINQSGTDITLGNPQLYLTANNPVASYGLAPETGLTITQVRNGSDASSYSIDNGTFSFATENGNVDYNYCLAPTQPSTMQAGYENSIFVPFSGLSDIVSGEGLPTALKVAIVNPGINGEATNFNLGQELELHGKYLFYAPLSLNAGSTIIYTDTRDGWSDEDLDKLTINKIEISATATSEVPLNVEIDGYPINTSGERIETVEVEGVKVGANAIDKEITIRITGTIQHLDGITFTAKAVSEEAKALSPNQKLILKNVKVRVSGNYTDEF